MSRLRGCGRARTVLSSGCSTSLSGRPPNKRMKLTRLAAAPGTPTQGAAAWARGLGTAAHRLAAYARCSADLSEGSPRKRSIRACDAARQLVGQPRLSTAAALPGNGTGSLSSVTQRKHCSGLRNGRHDRLSAAPGVAQGAALMKPFACARCSGTLRTTECMQRLSRGAAPPNKRMKLTKLSPAPFRGRRCRLMPAPARSDAGTASQLIRGVRPTLHSRGDVARIWPECGSRSFWRRKP